MKRLIFVLALAALLFAASYKPAEASCESGCWANAVVVIQNCHEAGGTWAECSQQGSAAYCQCMAQVCGNTELCVAQ